MLRFDKLVKECVADRREGWREFLQEYTPPMLRLLEVYLGRVGNPSAERLWRETLGELTRDRAALLRGAVPQSEKEFLVGLRRVALKRAALTVDPRLDTFDGLAPTGLTVSALLRDLPLRHQEIVFLKIAGHSDATLERMLRITPAVAREGLERLQEQHGPLPSADVDGGLWPAAWLRMLEQAWAGKTEACAELRQFIRIQEGQATWHDREPVERHTADCLHCLELWTSLLEMTHWRRAAQPLSASEAETLLTAIRGAPAPRSR